MDSPDGSRRGMGDRSRVRRFLLRRGASGDQQALYYTDIITFDYSDPDKRTIAGDLMISVDTVRDNARELGVPFENELQRVIIHGILHLCGYGDKQPGEQQRMRKLEDRYLKLFYEQTN